MPLTLHRSAAGLGVVVVAVSLLITTQARTQVSSVDAELLIGARVAGRLAMAAGPPPDNAMRRGATTSATDRRAAVDAAWGPGLPTDEKLAIFDKFWNAVDTQFAAFQRIDDNWAALRARYRPEIAAGVSRGRFAGIMNRMALSLREGHTLAEDLLVNGFTLPEPGVPIFGVGGWILDTSGACLTAHEDGSALVYDVVAAHPLGLEPGDRILGYDGVPWRELYPRLIDEELPMWPLWWGSGPEGYEHTFIMSAGVNWHHFEVMDVLKHATGTLVHLPLAQMPGAVFSPFCAEQLPIAGVDRPGYFGGDLVRSGVVAGTNVGYIYVYGWNLASSDGFAAAIRHLMQVQKVDGLIIDFRFNVGGLIQGSLDGLAALVEHPSTTFAGDRRQKPFDHLAMMSFILPNYWRTDFRSWAVRDKASWDGPIAVLVGPGAISAGDFAALLLTDHPRARTFGKTTAMGVGLPTQAVLGNDLIVHPDWRARVAISNTYFVGQPREYLIHTDFPVDERVWLTPDDVASGRDTVVHAALDWLRHETHPPARFHSNAEPF